MSADPRICPESPEPLSLDRPPVHDPVGEPQAPLPVELDEVEEALQAEPDLPPPPPRRPRPSTRRPEPDEDEGDEDRPAEADRLAGVLVVVAVVCLAVMGGGLFSLLFVDHAATPQASGETVAEAKPAEARPEPQPEPVIELEAKVEPRPAPAPEPPKEPAPRPKPKVLVVPDALSATLREVMSDDCFASKRAAETLARMTPNARRAEVTATLKQALAREDTFNPRREILRALVVWGPREEVVALLLDRVRRRDPFIRGEAFEALGKYQDEDTAQAVAVHLVDGDTRGEAGRALVQMGPVAENAVIKYLRHGDSGVRHEACRVVKVIGTRNSLADLRFLVRRRDGAAWAAQEAINCIEAR